MIEITETEALNRVAAYCSTAEHCRAEIAEKLQRWGIAYDAIDLCHQPSGRLKKPMKNPFCPISTTNTIFAQWENR